MDKNKVVLKKADNKNKKYKLIWRDEHNKKHSLSFG